MGKVIVVNERDEVLRYKDRNDRDGYDIIRVSGVWLFNKDKEVLIAQRAFTKVHNPGKWGPSAAGTVEEGETYVSNILKEVQEELGVKIGEKDLILGPKSLSSDGHNYFAQIFFVKSNLPIYDFNIEKDEVENIKWINIDELKKQFKDNPQNFLTSFEFSLKDISNFLENNFSKIFS